MGPIRPMGLIRWRKHGWRALSSFPALKAFPATPSVVLVSRRLAPESRLLSPFFGARSEIIRWSSIDARYLRAYGKSKYQQDTDGAGTRAEAIIKKGTLARSALNQGQNGTIDPTLPGTRSSLAERIASGCGRSSATLFAAPAGTLLTCLRNAVNAPPGKL
jgi:hypothetical protein